MFDYFTLNNLLQLIKIILNLAGVWVAFYFVLKIVKNNSRTIQIFKGILLILIVKGFAGLLGLDAIEYLANLFMQYGPIAIIIIFQPEIRSLLEKIGKTNVFSRISTLTLNEREKLVDELVKACTEMSKTKTGALISLEQGHSLNDYIKTGTPMNSVVTNELLCSIFVPGTPLHDGAVILQGVKIACAAAYFPPTTQDLPTMYGARHRAAVGISEITDSITIIVSEETGNISIAEGGKLIVVSEKSLRDFLTMIICQTQTEVGKDRIRKESDLEKDGEVQEEHVPKTNVITNLFRAKNKTEKKKGTENKFTKTKNNKGSGNSKNNASMDKTAEKIGIANLIEESMPLDNLFDSIISDSENKRMVEKEERKRSPLAKAKEESEGQVPPVKKQANSKTQASVDKAAKTAKQSNKVDTSTSDEKIEKVTEKLTPANQPASLSKKAETKKKVETKEEARSEVKREDAIETNTSEAQHLQSKEAKEKSVIKRSHVRNEVSDDIASLLDDVISPEAIVLNYKSDKKEDSSLSKDKKEGSDH